VAERAFWHFSANSANLHRVGARSVFVTKLLGKENHEMPDSSHLDFRTTELDVDLLATPFGIQTNWHVITGAPSCGKTTLINLLADKGFRTAPEGARLHLEREIARGRTIEEMRSNEVVLQCGIKDMQLEIERRLQADDFIFLDRAVPDCLAWYRVFGLNPNELLRECFHYRYASVFMLDPLPLQLNGLRYKDDVLQSFTDKWHTRDYSALGYSIVRVPVLPPKERLAFVLEVLSEQGLM
jgi:predicted ATPase